MYCCGFFLFSPRVIFELCGPINAKFCTMLGSAYNFIITVQNFEGASQKKFSGAKNMQNLAPISVDFEVRRRISLERMKVFKLGELILRQQFLLS